MAKIAKIGSVLGVDEQGFIIRKANIDKIVEPWRSLVDEIVTAYLNHWSDQVHSIYIRGSVAVGQAIPFISDVDSFAVVSGNYQDCDRHWFDGFNQHVRPKYPFCKGVELSPISGDRLRDFDDYGYGGLRMLIVTQAACVYGQDISPELPKFKPDIDAVSHAFDLSEDIQEVSFDLLYTTPQKPPNEQTAYVHKLGQWIMKRILRSGLEIVMERHQCYTRDLYPCYQIFSEYYPAQKTLMYQALNWSINPLNSPQEIVDFLATFGSWLVAEIDHVYPPQISDDFLLTN